MTDATTPADASPAGDGAPDVETVLVSASGTPRLHLPADAAGDASDAARPRCSVDGDLRAKSLAVYPPAHRTWCHYCLDAWRAHEGDATVEGSS